MTRNSEWGATRHHQRSRPGGNCASGAALADASCEKGREENKNAAAKATAFNGEDGMLDDANQSISQCN